MSGESPESALASVLFDCVGVRASNIDGASPTLTFVFTCVYERDRERWQSRFTQGFLELSVRDRGWMPAIKKGDRVLLTLAEPPPPTTSSQEPRP